MNLSEDTVLLIFEIIDVIISGLTNGSVYALMAVGMTLVYGVTKAFNFAYGELFNLGGYFAWTLIAIVGFGGGYVMIFIVVIPLMFAVGYALEKTMVAPLRKRDEWEMKVMMLTLGLALFMDNLYAVVFGGRVKSLPAILEGISEACGYTRNVTLITEHVRTRLARQISHGELNAEGHIPLVTLSPKWEQAFAEALVGDGDERQLSMAPSTLQAFITEVRESFERHAMAGESPALLSSPGIRLYVRSIVERFRPATVVMSQNEIHPKVKIKTLGQI